MSDPFRKPVITLSEFFHELIEALTNFDSRLVRSVRALISNPGHLTSTYLKGDTETYVRPLKLFLIVYILFFFVGPHVNVFNNDLASYFLGPSGKHRAILVRDHIEALSIPPTLYHERFNTAIQTRAASIIFVLPLFFTLFLALFRRRTHHFVEHLIFAVHYTSAFLTLLMIGGILDRIARTFTTTIIMFVLPAMLLLLLMHLYRSIRDVYAYRRLTSILMAPVAFVAFVLSFGIYNYAIFYLTYLLI